MTFLDSISGPSRSEIKKFIADAKKKLNKSSTIKGAAVKVGK